MSLQGKQSGGNAKGSWRSGKGSRLHSLPSTPAPPLGEILVAIQLEDLEYDDDTNQSDDFARINDAQYLTSYNWINGKDPQIIVPGEPAAWTPLSKPTQLHPDNGVYYRDKNAARYPLYPLEPMIRAIKMEKPEFSLESLDIVGCGSTLGHLLRFARGRAKPFRMLVEVVGNTVFFIRRENSPTETIPDVRGYSHTFPEAYTTWSKSAKGSESHQRLITYDFAGMNCLVRFEVDGYLPDMIPNGSRMEPALAPSTNNDSLDGLLSSTEAATISTVQSTTMDESSTTLKISRSGCYIPQRAVFDLKTRMAKKK